MFPGRDHVAARIFLAGMMDGFVASEQGVRAEIQTALVSVQA